MPHRALDIALSLLLFGAALGCAPSVAPERSGDAEAEVDATATADLRAVPPERAFSISIERPAELDAPEIEGAVQMVPAGTSAWTGMSRGGVGGAPYRVSCAVREIAVGIYGRSADFVDQLGLLCAFVASDGALGPPTLRGAVGGGGGRSFLSTCPRGQGVAGLIGRSGAYIDQIQVLCKALSGAASSRGEVFGGTGGSAFKDIAPGAHFLTSISGRSGSYADALQGTFTRVAP